MSSLVHIPIEELPPETKTLFDHARSNAQVFVDGQGESFLVSRITASPGRTATEILADPTIKWSNVTVDDEWVKDMEEIIALRKTEPVRDPWA